MYGILPSIDTLKTQAKALRTSLAHEGQVIGHSQALELVAKTHGYRDWNTMHSAVGNAPRPPVQMGQIVEGRYLGQAFVAEVIGIQTVAEGHYRVTVDFAEPVDVVTFDSFSNFRSRVSSVVDSQGRSFYKTSNGVPQMVLQL